MSEPRIYLGIPTYDGRVGEGIINAILETWPTRILAQVHIESGSWITKNFNTILAGALNAYCAGKITHLVMLHEDISIPQQPNVCWLEKFHKIMTRVDADLLSVVVPIKSPHGLTSTALDEQVGQNDPHWRVRRLTLTEVIGEFQPTFTHEKLLLNTGLMMIDLSAPWADKLWFEFEDRIIEENGKFMSVGMSEDWNYSRKARAMGAKIWATREIVAIHHGRAKYANNAAWGLWKKDQ